MNTERDKFLTEAMGECWHKFICIGANGQHNVARCNLCGTTKLSEFGNGPKQDNTFSTWEGFGKLWEWVSRQENMMCGLASRYNGEQAKIKLIYISPDTFADAVYNYLKEQQQ